MYNVNSVTDPNKVFFGSLDSDPLKMLGVSYIAPNYKSRSTKSRIYLFQTLVQIKVPKEQSISIHFLRARGLLEK